MLNSGMGLPVASGKAFLDVQCHFNPTIGVLCVRLL